MAETALQTKQPLAALRLLAQVSTKSPEARSLIKRSIQSLKNRPERTNPDKEGQSEGQITTQSLSGSASALSCLASMFNSDPEFRRRSGAVRGVRSSWKGAGNKEDASASDHTIIDSLIQDLVEDIRAESEEDGVLTRLMDLCISTQETNCNGYHPFSHESFPSLISIIASCTKGAEADRLTFVRACRGRPLSLLLTLYSISIDAEGDGLPGVSNEILSSILSLVSQEKLLVRAEAFTLENREKGRIVQISTGLIGKLLEVILSSIPLITHSSTTPLLSDDGRVKSYATTRSPIPCSTGEGSQLEKWVSILTELSLASKATSRELYRSGAVDFLDECLRDLSLPPSLLSAIERCYGSIAVQCELLAMDICTSQNLALLCGVSMHSSGMGGKGMTLALAALDRLSSLVDSCSAQSFSQLLRPGGVIHCSYQLLSSFINSKSSSKPSAGGIHPWSAAVMSLSSPSASQATDPTAQHSSTFRDICRSLFFASIERARRMEGKKPPALMMGAPGKIKIPCVGFLAFLRPRDVILMERQLKMDENSCLAPYSIPSASPKSGEGVKKAPPIIRHPSPTSPLDLSVMSSQGSSKGTSQGSLSSMDQVEWTQTQSEIHIKCMSLPLRTLKKDVTVDVTPENLQVSLGTSIVLQGKLRDKVDSSGLIWTLGHEKDGSSSLELMLVKARKGHYWRSLFVGGLEKSHVAILQEAISSDDLMSVDDSPGARDLLTSLRERQKAVVDGTHSLENSFDDFRLVLGDEML